MRSYQQPVVSEIVPCRLIEWMSAEPETNVIRDHTHPSGARISATHRNGTHVVQAIWSSFRKVVAGSGAREQWNTGCGPAMTF